MFVLFGPPGVGKSTLGARLANGLSLPFYDIDYMISPTPHILWREQGPAHYKELEAKAVEQLTPGSVIACGGSTIFYHKTALAKLGTLIYLSCPLNILITRYFNKPRAMVKDADSLRALLKARIPQYESIPAKRIDTAQSLDLQIKELLP